MHAPHGLFKAVAIVFRLEVLGDSATHQRLGADSRKGKRTMKELDRRPVPRANARAASQLAELITPEYIPAEVFLENMGFFTPSSKRIKGIYVKEKKVGEKIDPDGTRHTLKVEISANHKLGLPITSDLDYYRAFLKICDEVVDGTGRFHLPIAVPTKKLLRYAGKGESKKAWEEVRRWFDRMTFTGIKGAVFQAKSKSYSLGFSGTVFSQVVVTGEHLKNGQTAETNYVWPAPWFLSNYFYGHLRLIDLEFHKWLRKPIAKSLYPLLETGWYASNGEPYAKSYRALCEEFLLTRHRELSLVKQQLDPAHKELKDGGFLAKREYRKASDDGDWIITYVPGERFFAEQKAREERREIAEQIERGERGVLAQASPDSPDGALLDEILAVCGDKQNQGAYVKAIHEHPEGLLRMALHETMQAARERRIRKSNGAFFMDTLKRLSDLHAKAKAHQQ
jgi:hypothetical protein